MGRPFQKGNQAAKGRTMAPDFMQTRRLTRVKLEETIHEFMHLPADALKRILREPGDTPAYKLMVVSMLAKAASGDTIRAQFLTDRIHGKVVDKIEMKTQDVTDEERVKSMADELLRIARKPE